MFWGRKTHHYTGSDHSHQIDSSLFMLVIYVSMIGLDVDTQSNCFPLLENFTDSMTPGLTYL